MAFFVRFVSILVLSQFLRYLSDTTFTNFLQSHTQVLVLFLSPTCSYSHEFMSSMISNMHIITARLPDVNFVRVDIKDNPIVRDMYEVNYTPLLMLFINGTPTAEYKGERDMSSLQVWLVLKTKDAAHHINSLEDLRYKMIPHESFLLFFSSSESIEEERVFEAVARRSAYSHFGKTQNATLYGNYHITSPPAALLLKPQDATELIYYGPWRESRFALWYDRNWRPWYGTFNDRAVSDLYSKRESLLVILTPLGYSMKNNEEMRTFAAEVKNIIRVVVADRDYEAETIEAFFGVPFSASPACVILQWEEDVLLKYRYLEAKITASYLKTFVDRWTSGLLTPYFKSAQLPKPPSSGPVTVLVGKNFEDTVSTPGKSTIVFIYVPKSLRATNFLHIFEGTAEKYKSHPGLLFAKFDASVNDLKDWTPLSFPVVRYYHRNRSPQLYLGELTEEAFQDFLDTYVVPD